MARKKDMNEQDADTLADRLNGALAGVGIELGYGRPTAAGTTRNGTLRVELYLDAINTTDLSNLIAILEDARRRNKGEIA